MIAAAIPENEAERLSELQALGILDTPPERRFDRIVQLAARIFEVPISYIAMVDSDRQWFKARCGLTTDETGREVSFCAHTILQNEPLIIRDAAADERFHDSPLVTGPPHIRFYGGWPLAGPGGRNVGTLCLASPRPRSMSPDDLQTFKELKEMVEHELSMVELIRAQRELIRAKTELLATREKLAGELNEAAAYVQSLLPPRLKGAIRTDWRYIASSQLGGDFFGYHWLDQQRLAVYVLDVCGHGVGASLLSISVHNALRMQALPDTDFGEPAQVLSALNDAFPMESNNNKFFTIWYGVYDAAAGELTYASGGHPPALLMPPDSSAPARLGDSGYLIGILRDAEFDTLRVQVAPGSRLYLYTDGAFELSLPDQRMLELDGFVRVLEGQAQVADPRIAAVVAALQDLQRSPAFLDDFSLIEMTFGDEPGAARVIEA